MFYGKHFSCQNKFRHKKKNLSCVHLFYPLLLVSHLLEVHENRAVSTSVMLSDAFFKMRFLGSRCTFFGTTPVIAPAQNRHLFHIRAYLSGGRGLALPLVKRGSSSSLVSAFFPYAQPLNNDNNDQDGYFKILHTVAGHKCVWKSRISLFFQSLAGDGARIHAVWIKGGREEKPLCRVQDSFCAS